MFSPIIYNNKDLKISNILLWIREVGNRLLKGLYCQNGTGFFCVPSYIFIKINLIYRKEVKDEKIVNYCNWNDFFI